MKKWYTSKTLWINLLVLIAMVAQGITGKEIINIETQAILLGLINLVLRIVTNTELKW